MGAAYEAARKEDLIPEAKPPLSSLQLIEAGSRRTSLDYRMVRAPALAFFVINKPEAVGRWFEPFEIGYKGEQIRRFEQEMKRHETVILRDTDHLFFVDSMKIDEVVMRIRSFLSAP